MTDAQANDECEMRRRRAAYRASYRGTKEMDFLLGRFAAEALPGMSEAELTTFEQFLAIADPDIQTWLTDVEGAAPVSPPDPQFRDLIDRIRAFHGLSPVAP